MRIPAQSTKTIKLHIHGRLRLILPLVQMGLAAVLMRLSFLYDVATRSHDMPGVHPGFFLLLLVNFPAGPLLQVLRPRAEPSLWLGILSVLIIGVLWYGIGSWILAYRERRILFPPGRTSLRVSADLLLIAMGVLLGWAIVAEFRDYPFMISPSHFGGWFWFAPICIFALFWSVGPILVFGYDLGNYVRHRYGDARMLAKRSR